MPIKDSDGTGGPSSREHGLGHEDVERSCHLESLLVSRNDVHRHAEPFDQTRIISGIVVGQRMRLLQHSARETLRSLNGTKD